MTAVLQRLQSKIGYKFEREPGNNAPIWGFSNFLEEKPTAYFESFVRSHAVLNFEYSVFCSKLANDLLQKNSGANSSLCDDELNEQVASALAMSELLTYIYRHYLSVPREVARLKEEQAIFRTWLQSRNYYQFEASNVVAQQDTKTMSSPGFFTQQVRDRTAWLNWPRLFTVRGRRVLTTLIQIPRIQKEEYFCRFILFADQFANPALTYFSWIFYVPRLAVNMVLLFKHLIPGPWLEAKEKDLSWLTRLQGQLLRRWFELGNDVIWLTGGLLNCFVLTGALAPIGMYLTISFFLFDALWAGLRAFIELGRLNKLEKQYALMEQEFRLNSPEKLKEIKEYQQHLQQRMSFERQRLTLSVITTSTLFLGMCLAIPAFANPVMVFIGAVLVVTITLINYLKVQQLEKQRPPNNLMELAKPQYRDLLTKEGIFKTSTPQPHLSPLIENNDSIQIKC
ncbi:hypothetical protein [Legionella cardiaca]|uniref:Coiled-coil protein n=1 Tax=Legionella cardiaca TaxID=1071983 RepID=A0ABY8APR5_9GAMM|nr:hypothetical protein [Legionella cardiaca]WED42708.1 hypothetical protein PXX05_12505 [Legionella cardiaca]